MQVPVIALFYEKADMGQVSRYVQRAQFIPHPKQSEGAFIDALVEQSRRLGESVLIPVDDATLVTVSRHKAYLDEHFMVACAEWNIVERVIDKHYTYALAETLNVSAPWSHSPESEAEVELLEKDISYPCLVKPRQSHLYFERFRKKMVRVENKDQLMAAYREAAQAGLKTMLQEWIPGDDAQGINYNSYCWNGQPVVDFTAEKVRLSPPSFGVPCVVVSKPIPEVSEPAAKMLKALGFYGYSCMEFKRDARDGSYKFMEINARYNRSILLSISCGINFPWLMYCHLTQGQRPSAMPYANGIYWIDELRDIAAGVQRIRQERYSLSKFIEPYVGPHIFAVFDWKDLRPFVKRCLDLCRIAGTKFLEAKGWFAARKRNEINKPAQVLQREERGL
ncbi:MAG: hypothetical protein A2X46_15840 [Lentisphaerae bacterium GWF2_57_35]|nr:MAG: hypothetical protein A2X46_15840 [Lentisphaerae bacterium GWF2_57_35]